MGTDVRGAAGDLVVPAAQAPARELTPKGRRTRDRLLAAARAVFGETRFAEVRITDITAAAGVSNGTFYTYFDSKESIFREVAAEALTDLATAVQRDPENHERDPVRDVEYATRQFFHACRRNAGVARSIEQLNSHDPEISRIRREMLDASARRSERWIRTLQAKGVCAADIDAGHTAHALHYMNVSVGYHNLVLSDSAVDIEPLVAAVTRIWARAVGLGG